MNDSTGQAVGIAVINGADISVSIQSPDTSLGTDVDYPLLVLTMPITATSGQFTHGDGSIFDLFSRWELSTAFRKIPPVL